MAKVLENILETAPEPPSSWYRQARRDGPTRASAPHKINDEVETIVLKALAKERERRYQSAETLGQDVENYLNGQPKSTAIAPGR